MAQASRKKENSHDRRTPQANPHSRFLPAPGEHHPGRESLRFRLHSEGLTVEELVIRDLEDAELLLQVIERMLRRELKFLGLKFEDIYWHITDAESDEPDNEEEQT